MNNSRIKRTHKKQYRGGMKGIKETIPTQSVYLDRDKEFTDVLSLGPKRGRAQKNIFKTPEEYRKSLLRKLTRKSVGNKPAKVLEAEKIIADYRKEQEDIKLQLSRLESSDCFDSVCPNCFFMRGISVHLKNSDGNDEMEKFNCSECNYVYEEPM